VRRKATVVSLAETDICWSLPAIPRVEDIDPLTLAGDELLPHIVDVHEELRAVRLVLAVALCTIAAME
jgi:hypothetical protein